MEDEKKVLFILGELFNKLCNCIRNEPEADNNLNPVFHLEECPYKIIVEQQDIEWKKETPTQDS